MTPEARSVELEAKNAVLRARVEALALTEHAVDWLDNDFVERFWRSLKWEEVYLNDYQTVTEAAGGLDRSFRLHNHARPHQALGHRTPAHVYGKVG